MMVRCPKCQQSRQVISAPSPGTVCVKCNAKRKSVPNPGQSKHLKNIYNTGLKGLGKTRSPKVPRETLNADVEAFLKSGGEIKELPSYVDKPHNKAGIGRVY